MIDINEVLAQSPVVENLKNFAGVDPNNKMGLMTPEKLASVVGEKIGRDIFLSNFPAKSKWTINSDLPCLVFVQFSIDPTLVVFNYMRNEGHVICKSNNVTLFKDGSELSIYRDSSNNLIIKNNASLQITCSVRILYSKMVTPKATFSTQ